MRGAKSICPDPDGYEFDPTNGIVGNRDLVRVAVARQPDQAVPLSGIYWGSRSDELGMEVVVNVKSIDRARCPREHGGLKFGRNQRAMERLATHSHPHHRDVLCISERVMTSLSKCPDRPPWSSC